MDLWFRAVRETLRVLTQDERYLGAEPGFLLALHTWGRSLSLHPPIHCLLSEGGVDSAGAWRTPKRRGFLPGRVVMSLFRGKFIDFLRQALRGGELPLPDTHSPQSFETLLKRLGRKKWKVNVRERYAQGEGVARYLARYVGGGPLRNPQIKSFTDTEVSFCYSAHEEHGRKERLTKLSLPLEEFIHRYLQQVPEPGRQVVRSYGLYAPTQADRLNQARALFGQAAVEPPERLDWETFSVRVSGMTHPFRCSQCGAPLRLGTPVPRPYSHPPP